LLPGLDVRNRTESGPLVGVESRLSELRTEKQIVFPPFRLDRVNQALSTGLEELPLTRKAYAVLLYLAERPGRLVTKEELLDAIWADTHVGDGVLKVAVAEIRKALNDASQSPRFIETAHRRGYRFIAAIEDERTGVTAESGIRAVEREMAIARVEAWMQKALEGRRQVVFITGETGIGKTTVVEAFVEHASAETDRYIAQGQCLEHFGEGEPYFPVLEALGSLCRQPARDRVIEILWRHAPTWLAQMPWLVGDTDRERLKRETLGAAKEGMLREMAEAIEAFTAETPLILVLEDLQWSDNSTVDLIGHLARRPGLARLLIVGTYRPAETIVKRHPLRELQRELQAHRLCAELPLELLSEAAVVRYLELRCPQTQFAQALARLVHERTDGNPLFVVNVVDSLISQGQIARRNDGWVLTVPLDEIKIGIPDSLQQLIENQLERLGEDERRVLSVGSVAGLEFSTRTLSGGMEASIAEIAAVCEALSKRRQFIRPARMIQLRDDSLLERYGFIHELYQRVLYLGVPQPRRVALHRRIGEFQEAAYADHLAEIAAELSVHFGEGRDYLRAVRYRRLSAENAIKLYANREAIEHLDHAMKLLAHIPPQERAALEVAILNERGAAHRTMDDNATAAADFEKAVDCARKAERTDWEVRALLKLSAVLFWIDQERGLAIAERAVDFSRDLPDPYLHLQARGYCASRRIRLRGWSDDDFQSCVAAADAARQVHDNAFLGLHTMSCSFFQSYRSQEREACRSADEGLRIALETNDSFLYISCQYFKAWALLHLGEWGQALQLVRDGIRLSENSGHGTATVVLRMIEARLHLQAFDFRGAREMAERTLPAAREGFPRLITLVALGEGLLGLGEYDRALQCFEQVTESSKQGRFRLDWIFHLPLYRALGELWLRRREFARARQDALHLCELAALPGQRTYMALGRRLLAEIAIAESNDEEAESQIERARAALENVDAPLAEWRVFATSTELARRLARPERAAAYLARAASALERIAASMGEDEPLRRSLEGAQETRALLRPAARGVSTGRD
jgi:DNA-binding winged helix-turn-helix (wHTH) protein/tetratricopeptide (TPR) repeat protein